MKLDENLRHALAGERTPKFLATIGADGVPNCVPVTTITAYDSETLVFGEFMMNKTRSNLLRCERVAVAVMTEVFEAWTIRGTFLGFEEAGPHVEFINRSRLFRYNAYTSIRAAGTIRVDAVSPKRVVGKTRVLLDFVCARAFARLARGKDRGTCVMPRPVIEKFSRLSAVRALAYLDAEQRPVSLGLMGCTTAGPSRLVLHDAFLANHEHDVHEGQPVAVAIITQDPIAYQVKGVYHPRKPGHAVIDLTECYSASPPLCGERLDTQVV